MSDGIARRDFVLLFAGVIGGEAGAGIYDILKGSSNYPVVIALSAISAMLFTVLIMVITYLVVVGWNRIRPRKVQSQTPAPQNNSAPTNLVPNLSNVIQQLESIVNLAVGSNTSSNSLTMAEVKAQVLAAYAIFKAQEASVLELQRSTQISLSTQTATINQLKRQATWTEILAIGTLLVAASSFILAIITYLHYL